MCRELLLVCSISLAWSGGHALAAQVSADSAIRAAPAALDSAAPPAADSGVAAVDSAASAVTTRPRPALVVNVPPQVDTVVARACESASAGSWAPNLLGVVFRAEASESDRTAAAREVGGTLVGRGDGREAYIHLPENSVSVRVAASRLIRLTTVSGVSEVSCPG
jgi:hypothetical protein